MEFTDVSAADMLLFLKKSDPDVIYYADGSDYYMKERVAMVQYLKDRMKQHVPYKSALAAKFEYSLYINAHNIYDYNDKQTLKKRIDDVVDKSHQRIHKTNVI
jgi:hypothetical protein